MKKSRGRHSFDVAAELNKARIGYRNDRLISECESYTNQDYRIGKLIIDTKGSSKLGFIPKKDQCTK